MRRTPAATAYRGAALLALGYSLAACSDSSSGPPTAASVEVTPNQASPRVGETVQLSASVKDAGGNILSGQSVSWSSSASAVASVSNSGLVTAHAPGQAIITAASGSRSGIATINVAPDPIASIAVAPTNDTLFIGETVQLVATMRDANDNIVTDRQITWTSASPAIASVSGTGLVTGVGGGTTTVTASADGKSAAATIRVQDPCSTEFAGNIAVGETINGTLSEIDCRLQDDTFIDIYRIQVTASTNVQIDMTASFDTWLILIEFLQNGQLFVHDENDDIDPGVNTNSRITFMLEPGHEYFILTNSFDEFTFGPYQLSVTELPPFVAGASIAGKPGRPPVAELLKAFKRKPVRE